ncbi:aminotransferase class I/II-fold pyridoxal phosphate-dependent enzyme [Paenibacillus sp. y28]|uniref:aminotransferase class I/II-fold pyridoxal phosphate-dependent enzyme n=1 Tax=Paenibacillus sp. y28 TaxID=3129110 RepID=UPI00301A21DA
MGKLSMSEKISPVVQGIPPSGIRKYFNLAEGNKDVISLGVGEPDFVTPEVIREAAARALEKGRTSYTPNAGLLELREAIAEYMHTRFQVGYEPSSEIMVTIGASEAIDLALRALITPGDEVILPVPSYIAYAPLAQLYGGRVVEVEMKAEDQFKLTAEALAGSITPRSKVLILNYPSNPTGAIMGYEDWLPLAKLAEQHDLIVIVDEIYGELTYGGKHVSFASLPGMKERTLVISGFSKAFAMTGWRVGYTCGHPDLIAAMLKIHQYTVLCAPIMGQIAALEALRSGLEEMAYMTESFNQRRRMFVQGLREIGLGCHEPQGAFYAFPCIAGTGLSSDQFAQRLLEEAKVAIVPGHVFGAGGEGFIRCSYAASVSRLNEALERMERFIKQLGSPAGAGKPQKSGVLAAGTSS